MAINFVHLAHEGASRIIGIGQISSGDINIYEQKGHSLIGVSEVGDSSGILLNIDGVWFDVNKVLGSGVDDISVIEVDSIS